MTTVSFTIPGAPYAKKRHRSFYNRRLGRAQSVNPAENASFEGKVAEIALPHFPTPIEGPVAIRVEAIFVPAASWSKRRRAESIGAFHTQKPDADNIMKAVKDGLNRVAWADDSQVADAWIAKRWGERAETRVTVCRAERRALDNSDGAAWKPIGNVAAAVVGATLRKVSGSP